MAEDPFASFIYNSIYSSSQEDLFNTSLHVRQNEYFPDSISPEPYPPPPSTAAITTDAFAGGGIVICSAPETPISNSAAPSSAEDVFKTPPEESRRSSSEEPPPPPLPEAANISSLGGESESPAVNLDGGTPDLGFPRKGKMVEVLSNGNVRVGEVSAVDLESFRVGEKRMIHNRSPIPSPSPSKRIRVSAKLVITPKLATTGEGECSAKRRVEFPIEMELKANMDVETVECNVDTEVIENSDDEQSCGNHVGISNAQEEEEEEEEVMENGNGNRQGRRELPSWACQKEDKREDESCLNTEPEQTVDDELRLVMEVMALLSKEAGPSRGTGDILETVKGRGLTFPEPKWWHDDNDDQDEG